MPIRWAFEMVAVLEYQSLAIINPAVENGPDPVRSLDNVIGFTHTTFSTPVTILLAFTSVFVGLTLIQLNRVSKSDDFRDDQRDTIAKIGVVMIVVISVLLGAYIGEPEPKSTQSS